MAYKIRGIRRGRAWDTTAQKEIRIGLVELEESQEAGNNDEFVTIWPKGWSGEDIRQRCEKHNCQIFDGMDPAFDEVYTNDEYIDFAIGRVAEQFGEQAGKAAGGAIKKILRSVDCVVQVSGLIP